MTNKDPFRTDIGTLRCPKCGADKDLDCFSNGKNKTGKTSWCKLCVNSYTKQYSIDNPQVARNSYHRNKNRPVQKLKALLRTTGRKKCIDRSELKFEDCWKKLEESNFTCDITGVPFVFETRHPQTLSIDRIDPSRGYTLDNIRFVCWWVNTAMGSWGLETTKKMIKEWMENDQKSV